MKDNFSEIKTPIPSEDWKNKSEKDRIEKISSFLKSNILYKDFIIIKALDNGQVIIKIDHLIAANKRGILLLDLESILKKKIDQGITIWCEPVGDKNKLRQLRGVTINT
jgi:Tfp pilus assembly protein PilZ